MNAITAYLLSMALFVFAAVERPTSAQCPHGWWLDGIRTSGENAGEFGCRPVPRVHPREEVRPYIPDDLDVDEDVEIYGRLYCDQDLPRALEDGRTATCWRAR